jgi:hypothetical protein
MLSVIASVVAGVLTKRAFLASGGIAVGIAVAGCGGIDTDGGREASVTETAVAAGATPVLTTDAAIPNDAAVRLTVTEHTEAGDTAGRQTFPVEDGRHTQQLDAPTADDPRYSIAIEMGAQTTSPVVRSVAIGREG